MTDPLAALAGSLHALFQLDALGLHGAELKRAVGRVVREAREKSTTAPVVMAEFMREWSKTGRVPGWLTAPEVGAGDE